MSRRVLSVPVLLATLVATASLGVIALFIHSWQVSRTAQVFLLHAARQEAESNWLKSADYLDRYLRLHPGDDAVRIRIASIYTRGALTIPQKRTAIALNYRALATGAAGAEEVRPSLMEFLAELGRFLEAEQEARRLLKSDPGNPRANRALAIAIYGQLKDGSLAGLKPKDLGLVQIVDKARQLNPADVQLTAIMSDVYRNHVLFVLAEFPRVTELERHQLADRCFDDLVSALPENYLAYLARYRYRLRYNIPQAESDLSKALSLAPNEPIVLQTAAYAALRDAVAWKSDPKGSQQSKAAAAKAEAFFGRLIAEHLNTCGPEVFLGHGDCYLELGNEQQAFGVWRRGLGHFEGPRTRIAFNSRIADYLITRERWKEAAETISLIDKDLDQLGVSVARDERQSLTVSQNLRHATWKLKNGQAGNAISIMRGVLAAHSKSEGQLDLTVQAWLLLGQCYATLSESLDSAIAFDRAASLRPGSYSLQITAANAWLFAERPDLASQRAVQANTAKPTYQSSLTLAVAQLQLQSGLTPSERSWSRFDDAISSLERFRGDSQPPEHWRLAFIKADSLVVKAKATQDPGTGIQVAKDVLRSAEQDFSKVVDFWSQLALSYEHLGMPADADRALNVLRTLSGKSIEESITTSRLATLRKNYKEAIAVLENATKSLSPAHRPKIQQELINVAFAKQDLDLLRSYLELEHHRVPHDLMVIQRLAEIDLERQNGDGLKRWDTILGEMGSVGEPLRIYVRVRRLLTAAPGQEAQLHELRSEQAKLIALRPTWPEAFTLRGMIEERLGNHEVAIASFEQALQLGEKRISVFEQLIAILDRSNRLADSERYLARLESQTPLSQRLTELASVQHIRFDQPQQAINIARLGVANRPKDPLARIWLGRLLLATKHPTEAEQEFMLACSLAPSDVQTWNGLFSFYLRTGATEKARKTMQQLVTKVKMDAAEKTFVLAQGSELLGEWEDAARLYQEAARQSPASTVIQLRLAGLYLRSDPTQAEHCLKKALTMDPKSVSARRMLAVLLATKGSDGDLRKAEDLLNTTDAYGLTAVEDRRLRALLLAHKGGDANLGTAVGLLEGILERGLNTIPADRLALAKLYEAQARRTSELRVISRKLDAAKQQLMILASRPDADSGHIATFIGFLLQNERVDEAGSWLETLEKTLSRQTKDNPDAIAQLIELRLQHGTSQRCATWLDRLAKADSREFRPLELRVRCLVSTNRNADVESVIEPFAKESLAKEPNRNRKQVLYAGISEVYTSARQYKSAERWIRLLVAEDWKHFYRLANNLGRQGRVSEAVELCQQISKQHPSAHPAVVMAATLVESNSKPEDFQRAEPFLMNALKQFKSDVQLLYALGVLRVVEGRSAESIDLFRRVIDINPKHVAAINNLALLLSETSASRKEAIALINKAIDISGMDPGLLDTKGAILIYDGQADKAVSLLELATRSQAANPLHVFHLAVAYRDTGNDEKAKSAMRQAIGQQLDAQILTPTDRALLIDMKEAITP